MMELRAFISEVLRAVVDGVADAQQATDPSKALISPERAREFSVPREFAGVGGDVQAIELDLAITATKPGGGKGTAHPIVWAATSAEIGRAASSGALSRLRFRVPVALPVQRTPRQGARS
jgi:hypothetical protein